MTQQTQDSLNDGLTRLELCQHTHQVQQMFAFSVLTLDVHAPLDWGQLPLGASSGATEASVYVHTSPGHSIL